MKKTIIFMAGDVTDPSTADRVAEMLPADARCIAIENSAQDENEPVTETRKEDITSR